MKHITTNKLKYLLTTLFLGITLSLFAQRKTDACLYLKKDKNQYLNYVESKSGNLFTKLGHHGPAVENQWLGFRIYFNKKTAIDVYSKAKPGLEIREKKWYPSKKEQKEGWGADYYKVGNTLGLGGVKLWDGEKIIPLHPVKKRWAKVETTKNGSTIKLVSEGISYKSKQVDIEIQVNVFNNKRNATVIAKSLTGESVQFVTGINYFKNLTIKTDKNYIATWGIHPEDVAAEKVEIGAAILFNPNDFLKQMDDGKQHLLISHPTTEIHTVITSANAREKNVNTFEKFLEMVQTIEFK